MEKDSDSQDSSLDDSQEISDSSDEFDPCTPISPEQIAKERAMLNKEQTMLEQELQEMLDVYKKKLEIISEMISHDETILSDPSAVESPASPIESSIHKSESLSKDTTKSLPDTSILAESLSDQDNSLRIMEIIDSMHIIVQQSSQDLAEEMPPENKSGDETRATKTDKIRKTSHHIQESHQASKEKTSPKNTSGYETRATETDRKTHTIPHSIIEEFAQASAEERSFENKSSKETHAAKRNVCKIAHHIKTETTNVELDKNYGGKGKEAANPKFRYRKGSKSNVASAETSAIETPVKESTETFGTPESKSSESQSPKPGLSRISPAMKRKESDSTKGCTSQFSGDRFSEEYLQTVKRLKFEEEKNEIKRSQAIRELLARKKYESKSLVPSSKGNLDAIGCITPSDSSESEGSPRSDMGDSSLTSVSEIEESSLASNSDGEPYSPTGEPSLANESE